MPLSCPECNKVMKKKLDKPNYRIHKKCYDCVINFEGKLKHVPNKYEKYVKELELKNKITTLDQLEDYLIETANSSNEGYISEKGELERWVGGINSKKFTKEIKKKTKKTKEKFEKELNESIRSKESN